MERWKDGRVEDWKNGRVEDWKSGRMEEWKVGRVEDWKIGRLEEWKGGRVEEWMDESPRSGFASDSIHRYLAEGYCRRSLTIYLECRSGIRRPIGIRTSCVSLRQED
jgi:hypothetical protein